jgi:hypothetical protein
MASDPRRNTANGRPVEYTAEIGRKICERILNDESLRAVCADPGMPDRETIRHWLAQHQDFRRSYDLAQGMLLQFLEDEILEIVDDADGDWIENVRPGGRVITIRDPQHLARCRLRANVRSWIADRMAGARTENVKRRCGKAKTQKSAKS